MEASDGLDLVSQSTMQGVAARFVATETLTFLVNMARYGKAHSKPASDSYR